ncbi:MAG: bifunctional ornithine acetyltransferase/N-acetylglutamate synthase, partial [Actinomycetota bacterium]
QLVEVSIGNVRVILGGEIVTSYFDDGGAEAARAVLREHDVVLSVSVGGGPGESRALGVDLSYEYVKINAEYTT